MHGSGELTSQVESLVREIHGPGRINNNNNNNKLIFPPDQIQFQKGAKKDDIKGHYIIVPVH